jgi:hypothetical protein
MTPKQTFLANIQAKIKILSDAYEQAKNLPNDVFEGLTTSGSTSSDESPVNGHESHYEETGLSDSGSFREAVRGIIEDAKYGIMKKDIMAKFRKLYPKSQPERTVTYALTGLQTKGEIRKYKPSGKSVKGYLWIINNSSK